MFELPVEHDGMKVYTMMALPEGDGPFPIVIFSHGFGSNRIYEIGMERDFTELGLGFVAFDFCGAGEGSKSSGTTLEMSVLTEAADLNAVIDAVCALDAVDERRLFLMGNSQGGYVSAYVAAQRPQDIAGLVLNFPAFVLGDDARKRIEEAGARRPRRRSPTTGWS